MNEHLNDEYVKKAQKEGYRCRAVYKLIEIIDKNLIISKGDRVLDLGAAPGGWSQVAAKIVGKTGQIIASDILPIEEIPGVDFLQGDFTEMSVYKALLSLTKDQKMNTVLSDMAPNMSGNNVTDQAGSMYLVELAFDMCHQVLKKNGNFAVKVFQGEGFDHFVKELRTAFKTVKIRKPDSSRARSREVYIVATGYKL